MATAQINHSILTWARERSGISMPAFAAKCGISEERLRRWEDGEEQLTFKQAQKFADKAYVPFGYLFLNEPPVDELPIPDLRTVGSSGVNRPSAELLDLIKLTLQRQQWYRDYLTNELASPGIAVGRVNPSAPTEVIVNDMRQLLGVPAHPQRGNWEDYYRDLITRIEAIGVLVMRESSLNHHTRPLRVEEFRGFAIAEEYAPVIFVNHADAAGARLFTLIHELCHIWMGISGVSDGSESSHHDSEVKCNAVAAEFLKGESGPNFHRTKNSQISKPFSRAVLSQAFNGQILLRVAGQLLGINPAKLKRFAKSLVEGMESHKLYIDITSETFRV